MRLHPHVTMPGMFVAHDADGRETIGHLEVSQWHEPPSAGGMVPVMFVPDSTAPAPSSDGHDDLSRPARPA